MIDHVEFLGLAIEPVAIGGPAGPVDIVPDGDEAIAVYRLSGWSSAPEDEAAGHRVCRLMEAVGQAMGDGQLSPSEATRIIGILEPRLRDHADRIGAVIDQVFAAVSDDGRISRQEALSIAWGVAQTLLRRV